MQKVNVNQVTAMYTPQWNKWPDSEDRDYSDIFSLRSTNRYLKGGAECLVTNRFYPVHSCYSGELIPHSHPCIDNTKLPPSTVLNRQLSSLRELSATNSVLIWRGGDQCYFPVVKYLKELFKLSIFIFGDDTPGSSEIKSFPVASCFDVVLHGMGVWDFNTGERVRDKYLQLGVPDVRFAPIMYSTGVFNYVRVNNFNIGSKVDKMSRNQLPLDLIFVGGAYPHYFNSFRARFTEELNSKSDFFKKANLSTKFFGSGMRDGVLEPRIKHSEVCAPWYEKSIFGVNPAMSSLFNARLFDFWLMGVVQLIYDPNKELKEFGVAADEHYIAFDGSVEHLIERLLYYKKEKEKLSYIVKSGFKKVHELIEKFNSNSIMKDLYYSYIEQGILC